MRQCKRKVKCTLVQALRLCADRTAHRGSTDVALLFLDHSTRRGGGSTSRLCRSLLSGKTRCPLYRRLGGPQGRSGKVRKISPTPELRSPDRPVRSQSLCRLRYPAHMRQYSLVEISGLVDVCYSTGRHIMHAFCLTQLFHMSM